VLVPECCPAILARTQQLDRPSPRRNQSTVLKKLPSVEELKAHGAHRIEKSEKMMKYKDMWRKKM
jgi:hypothetical protein